MSGVCSSCGSDQASVSMTVECVYEEHYELNEPGSPRRSDVLGRETWDIQLCRSCARRRLEEAVTKARRWAFLTGPVALGVAIVGTAIAVPLLAAARAPLLSLAVLGTLAVAGIFGLIMVPIGVYRAAKATSRLRRLQASEGVGDFDDQDRWELIQQEGKRIINLLEENQRDFYGNFALPDGSPRHPGMGESTLSYRIHPA
ncbi:MAG: hypothetical protein ACOC95_07535 [Planctomycetota bacterium]